MRISCKFAFLSRPGIQATVGPAERGDRQRQGDIDAPPTDETLFSMSAQEEVQQSGEIQQSGEAAEEVGVIKIKLPDVYGALPLAHGQAKFLSNTCTTAVPHTHLSLSFLVGCGCVPPHHGTRGARNQSERCSAFVRGGLLHGGVGERD